MFIRVLTACTAIALSGCVWKSDLDAANTKLAKANTDLAVAAKTIDDLKAQIATAQAQNAQLDAKLAVRPSLPVTMTTRKMLFSAALTAVFNTTVKTPIQVLVTVRNLTLGTAKQIELHLNPNMPTYLGAPQGVPIDSGDQIVVSNNDYSPSTFVVP
jgi:hypothetical protein